MENSTAGSGCGTAYIRVESGFRQKNAPHYDNSFIILSVHHKGSISTFILQQTL